MAFKLAEGESDVPVVVNARSSAQVTSCIVVSMLLPTFGNTTSCLVLEAFVEKMSDGTAFVFGMACVDDFELFTTPWRMDVPTDRATVDAGVELGIAAGATEFAGETSGFKLLPACGTATKIGSLLMLRRAVPRLFEVGVDFVISEES